MKRLSRETLDEPAGKRFDKKSLLFWSRDNLADYTEGCFTRMSREP